MRNLNKSNVLITTESINRTLKKKSEQIIFKIWVQYVPSSVKVGSFFFCSAIQGLSKKAYEWTQINRASLIFLTEHTWGNTGSIPAGVSGFFIDIKSFRSHYGPGVDSASNRNEYQEYFLGVKAAGA